MLLDSFIVVFGIPAVLPVVCKKALAKEKSKISFLTSKKKGTELLKGTQEFSPKVFPLQNAM